MSTWQVRASLSAEEKQRREQVILTISRETKLDRVHLLSTYQKAAPFLADNLSKQQIAPTLSAKYFIWRLDSTIWEIAFRREQNRPEFPFPAPDWYGSPYSEPYLTHLMQNENEIQTRFRLSINVDYDAHEEYTPSNVERHPEFLARLWTKMFQNKPYEEGCSHPFSFRFFSFPGQSLAACLGQDEDEVTNALAQASSMLWPEFVIVLTRSNYTFLSLDFAEGVQMESLFVQGRFKQAWHDLLALNLEWIVGRNVHILDAIQEIYSQQVSGPPKDVVTELARAHERRSAREAEQVRNARQTHPNDPNRAAKLRHFQVYEIRQLIKDPSCLGRLNSADPKDQDECCIKIRSFVRDQRFGCLAKEEMLQLVKGIATRLAEVRVTELLREPAQAEAALTKFCLDPEWNDILSPTNRLEVCESILARVESVHPLADWADHVRTKMTERDQTGEVSEAMSNMTLTS